MSSSSTRPTSGSDGWPRDRDAEEFVGPADDAADHDRARDRTSVVRREQEEHGGVKIGSAFFGFLAATGVGVLLTTLVAAAGAAVGVASGTTAEDVTSAASDSPSTVSVVSGIILLVIVFTAYYCGGYVASRMARFNGIKQGIAVWVWALVMVIGVAILGAAAGSRYDILSQLNSFPRIPIDQGDLTTGGLIALVVLVVVSLAGAIIGGLAGMRFHRSVDKTGLGN